MKELSAKRKSYNVEEMDGRSTVAVKLKPNYIMILKNS